MIRIATTKDVPAILEIYTPYVLTTTHTFEYVPPTLEEFYQRFASITEKLPWLVWEEDGQVLGYAYASLPFHRAAYSWSCEVSIYVSPPFPRKRHRQKAVRRAGAHPVSARLSGHLFRYHRRKPRLHRLS